jgi:hypothetical protein
MNASTEDLRTGPGDDLDRVLIDFFKAEMKRPWPAPPVVTSAEPSTVAAARAAVADAPRNRPVPRDTTARSRYTLAASVALLLGTCWYCSNGFQPAAPVGQTPQGDGMLDKSRAGDPAALEQLKKDKALKGGVRPGRPPIELP